MSGLERFLDAQGPIYEQALAELRAGRKESHWMWFIFPQLRGLGTSEYAYRYGVSGSEEAVEYLAHPLLAERLRACSQALLDVPRGTSAEAILGPVDAAKLRSSMTLFAALSHGDTVFAEVLDRFFGGPDPRTLEMLGGADSTAR